MYQHQLCLPPKFRNYTVCMLMSDTLHKEVMAKAQSPILPRMISDDGCSWSFPDAASLVPA